MSKIILPFIVVAAIAGCASQPKGIDPVKRAEIIRTIPTCSNPDECERKWGAARRWVLSNAAYRIRVTTPDFIETFAPTGGSPNIGARVLKDPLGEGRYRIVIDVWCDNMFGCVPNAADAVIAFNRAVSAAK